MNSYECDSHGCGCGSSASFWASTSARASRRSCGEIPSISAMAPRAYPASTRPSTASPSRVSTPVASLRAPRAASSRPRRCSNAACSSASKLRTSVLTVFMDSALSSYSPSHSIVRAQPRHWRGERARLTCPLREQSSRQRKGRPAKLADSFTARKPRAPRPVAVAAETANRKVLPSKQDENRCATNRGLIHTFPSWQAKEIVPTHLCWNSFLACRCAGIYGKNPKPSHAAGGGKTHAPTTLLRHLQLYILRKNHGR